MDETTRALPESEINAVVVFSGGMDSTTLLYRVLDEGYTVHAVSFDYGQRHTRELDAARTITALLDVKHSVIDLSALHPFLASALTDATRPVPHGHYAEENMRQTVVPNRNAIMLAIAWGMATAEGAEIVATGVHAGDHFIYPDCRPEFIAALQYAFRLGTTGHADPTLRLYTPYLNQTKIEIAQDGTRLGVPYDLTWTCYEGGEVHCGVCGSCQERREGFRLAGVPDPTRYANLTVY